MAINRIFIGWDKPLCETVPAFILYKGTAGLLDLRGTVVVVPTRQSSWRLRAALPLVAHTQDISLLGPEIVTPPVLLEPPHTTAVATALQGLLAWHAVLLAAKPGEFSAFLGTQEHFPYGTGWALQVARRLQNLRQELADGGLAIADVAARGTELEECERWSAMAALEGRYAEQLARWNLHDALNQKLAYARKGLLAPEVRHVIVAAVPDPPQLFMTLLNQWAAAGGTVHVLIAAPDNQSDAFDAWGRPSPDVWGKHEFALQPDTLWLEATPDDQASRIAKAIASTLASNPAAPHLRPQLAIGVPDRETVAPLQRELEAINLPAFDPQNRPLSETTLFRLVQALLALRNRPGYAEAAALLRQPDVLALFGQSSDLLRELDHFQSEHLPVQLEDMLRREPTCTPLLATARNQLQEWRTALRDENLAAGLRRVLQQIFAGRNLQADNPADAAFQQSVAAFDAGLRELETATAAGQTGAVADAVLLARLQDATIKAERHEECLDLEGWLELAWNPAPLLFVAGMNEGFVPDGHVGDIFLPDTLRHQLGLRDDQLRVARDTYVLTALMEQRHTEGRVILLIGKTSTAGDPLRPSRLLFRCPDSELVPRAQMLFQDPPPTRASAAFTISFKLDPARISNDSIDQKRSQQLSPSIFRDYLACPLRFYLQHVLNMRPMDDRAREPDARAFGTLVHEVLNEMGSDRKYWGCSDADKLGSWLEDRLLSLARRSYGSRPWLGVDLAIDSGIKRLHAFAQKQVVWHAEGWELIQQETSKNCELGGIAIRGRIDRMDRNARTGAVCVFDYKTSDKAMTPSKAHMGPPRPENLLTAAAIPATVAGTKHDQRWTDLQLPLYRELVRAEFGPDVQLGYICLPNALGDTGFAIWDSYNDALHTSALQCAEAIVQQVKAGTFWPPGKLKSGYQDDLSGVLLGDPEATLCPPAAPWRAEA